MGLWRYWLLSHMIGASHLRYYQTAEHRSCTGNMQVTDTSAWVVSRTTTTWWFYCQLAWNMPYHAEHHSWPNVPFHLLPAVHEAVKKNLGGKMPKSGCDPDGSNLTEMTLGIVLESFHARRREELVRGRTVGMQDTCVQVQA